MDCFRTSNNKFFNAPPRMADGRHFTDYRPNCHVNNMIRNKNEVFNSFDYRLFLTINAEKIMESNVHQAQVKNASTQCKKPFETGTMLPEQDKVVCNKHNCNVEQHDSNGLGRGRIYARDPAECLTGLTSSPLELGMNKCTPPSDNFRYYPDSAIQGEEFARVSVPSGGDILQGGDPAAYQ